MAQVGQIKRITANGTTVLSTNSCVLLTVNVNKIGASSNVITIYDDPATTNNAVAIIDTTIAGAPTRIYNGILQNGCTVVSATGTAADVTIVIG